MILTARRMGLVAALMVLSATGHSSGSPGTRDLPATTAIGLGHGLTMEFILIPAGSFQMGSDENTGDGDESPIHRVTLTRPFYLGKFEVTQEQWEAVVGNNPSIFKGPKLPVDTVSWSDCHVFLKKLATQSHRKFALPTEAQWEYACRAGTSTPWSFGAQPALISEYAWLGENSGGTTHPVGSKKPNPWGLYDMHGNVQEWCADSYAKHSYPAGAITDPTGPAPTESRILRGGAWGDDSDHVRSASRNCNGPDGRTAGIGFRCVLLAEGVSP